MSLSTSRWHRLQCHPLVRMALASLAMFLALALSFGLGEAVLPRDLPVAWPNALAALACALGYCVYVKVAERRKVTELGVSGSLAESVGGLALGALLALLTLAPLWAIGVYRIEGSGDTFPLVKQIPEMLLVAVMEELLMRAVVFRIAQQAWGTRAALVLSTVLFVIAHLPGNINAMGMLVTAAASLALTAAYQLSGRLWLPIGMHFAWNYLFAAVFSVPVSGHEATGWLHGLMSGPEWLSGGPYGVEASAMALLAWSVAAVLLLRRVHGLGRFVLRPPPAASPAPAGEGV